jgi:hypothetical protein
MPNPTSATTAFFKLIWISYCLSLHVINFNEGDAEVAILIGENRSESSGRQGGKDSDSLGLNGLEFIRRDVRTKDSVQRRSREDRARAGDAARPRIPQIVR